MRFITGEGPALDYAFPSVESDEIRLRRSPVPSLPSELPWDMPCATSNRPITETYAISPNARTIARFANSILNELCS